MHLSYSFTSAYPGFSWNYSWGLKPQEKRENHNEKAPDQVDTEAEKD